MGPVSLKNILAPTLTAEECAWRPTSYWTDEDDLSDLSRPLAASGLPLVSPDPSGAYDPKTKSVEIAWVALHGTVNGDVIAVVAVPTLDPFGSGGQPGTIDYKIVDGYGSDEAMAAFQGSQPLTTGELIRLMDSSEHGGDFQGGLVLSTLEMHRQVQLGTDETDAESWLEFEQEHRDMVEVSSEFYPQLAGHYARVIDKWFEAHKARCR